MRNSATVDPCALLRPVVGPPPRGIDPRVLRVTFVSAVLGVRKAFYVLLPVEYTAGEGTNDRYATLYLLRGHEREWVNPTEDGSCQGTVVDILLRLRASGAIGPLILVFPGVTSEDGRVHGVATDFRDRALAPNTPGLGTGRFETYLVRELIPLVDALFRTHPDRRRRGVDGFSLGGLMAAKLALKHPNLFASAGAYDGTFLYADTDGTGVRGDDKVYKAGFLNPVFGVPRDGAYAAANNPANLIINGSDAIRTTRWLLQYGPKRLEPLGSNYDRGAYLRALLAAHGADVDLPPVIAVGAHNWATADRHMELTLPLHWDTLR